MKKLSSVLIFSVLGLIISVGLTGCGANMPKPYSVKAKNYAIVADNEKDILFSKSMKDIPKFYPFTRGSYSSPSKLINDTTISYSGLNAIFAHQFKIDYSTNEIYRTDISREKHGNGRGKDAYGSLTDDYGFSDYINDFQIKLGDKYNTEIEKYSLFKETYNKKKKDVELKKQNITIELLDLTNILPISIINQLSSYSLYISIKDSAIKRFIKNKSANAFIINSSIKKDTIGRYKVNYERKRYTNSYDKFPSHITYKINKVYFNYLPEKFVANDNNIDVEVLNDFLSYKSIKYIKIYNKTKEFIEVDTIAGYYGNIVTDNIINIEDMKRVKISPMSYKIFKTGYSYKYKIIDFPEKKLLLVDNKNQKINYGFSIAYKMVNQNIIKNLYKVNTYSIKDFK